MNTRERIKACTKCTDEEADSYVNAVNIILGSSLMGGSVREELRLADDFLEAIEKLKRLSDRADAKPWLDMEVVSIRAFDTTDLKGNNLSDKAVTLPSEMVNSLYELITFKVKYDLEYKRENIRKKNELDINFLLSVIKNSVHVYKICEEFTEHFQYDNKDAARKAVERAVKIAVDISTVVLSIIVQLAINKEDIIKLH